MYETFYNLKAEPFRLSPDHRFCYDHKCYAKARAYMAYAFRRAEGFVMITGRPGTGKTTLIGELVESLAAENVITANLVCTQLQADDLLKVTAYSFGVDHGVVEKGELLQQLGILLRRWHRDGRRALLIVDEAQDLSESAMEELRLLTNIQENGKPLLQIFLLGQPELRGLVLSPSMEQVHQRIVAASHLEALEEDETEAYIIHRLEKVGWQGDPALSKTIYPLIYKFSEGVPRRINLICSRLFLHGCVEQLHRIGTAELREVIRELQAENLAAGTQFSEDDFLLEDEFDHKEKIAFPVDPSPSDEIGRDNEKDQPQDSDIPVNQETGDSNAQEYPHAVGDEVVIPLDIASGRHASDSKKKDDVIALRPSSSDQGEARHSTQSGPTDIHPEHSPVSAKAPSIEQIPPIDDNKENSTYKAPQHVPESDKSYPEPKLDGDPKPHSDASDESKTQPGNRLPAILSITVIGLLIAVWLTFDRGLINKRDLKNQADELWDYVVTFVTSVRGDDQSTGQSKNINSPRPEPKIAAETSVQPEQKSELDAYPNPLTEAEQQPEQEPELKPEPGFDAQSESPSKLRPADQFQTAQPEPGSLALSQSGLATAPADTINSITRLSNIRIRFGFDSTSLGEEAKMALDNFAETFLSSGFDRIKVTGYADEQGDMNYNLALSRRRADAVAKYLVARGVDAGFLVVRGLGVNRDINQVSSESSTAQDTSGRIVELEALKNKLTD